MSSQHLVRFLASFADVVDFAVVAVVVVVVVVVAVVVSVPVSVFTQDLKLLIEPQIQLLL